MDSLCEAGWCGTALCGVRLSVEPGLFNPLFSLFAAMAAEIDRWAELASSALCFLRLYCTVLYSARWLAVRVLLRLSVVCRLPSPS